MKIDLISFGRFHLFNLANQLYKHEVLNKFIISHPKSKLHGLTIPNQIIDTNNFEYIRRLLYLLGDSKNNFIFTMDKLNKLFSKNASNKISTESDIVIALSDSALEILKEAKEAKKTTILERGSSHILYALNLLEHEGKIVNKEFNKFTQLHIDRCMEEYELADYISIPSSFVKRSFLEYGVPEEKLLVNPYGVDLSKFHQVPKNDYIFRIIYAGGLTFQKGSHYLLQAFDELSLKNCELWHLGSINDEIKPYIEKYKNENIKFLGHKPQNELYKYYSQGSMFIIPSIQEGMAMVQLQAMACGLPLICTTNTGGDDLITKDGEEGFVIPIRDIDAIKEKILYLYENQDIAKEMGQKAKKRVSLGFTWDDYGDRYIENLERILSAKNK